MRNFSSPGRVAKFCGVVVFALAAASPHVVLAQTTTTQSDAGGWEKGLRIPGIDLGALTPPPSPDDVRPVVPAAETEPAASGRTSSLEDYFANWYSRVEQARASQPPWLVPLGGTSPLITELVRWDVSYQWLANDAEELNLGNNKGIFLVPTVTNEVDIGLPSFQKRYDVDPAQGLADWQFVLVKQRLFSATAQEGNYILTAALAAQAPIGDAAFTEDTYVITPILSGGKGFGNFNIQADTRFVIPTSHQDTLGTAWATNVTFQYDLKELLLWPEFEVNWTHWLNGSQREGENQVFLTVGAIIGPIPLTERLGLLFGAGYQFAVTPQRYTPVLTPTFHNGVLFTSRLNF